MLNINTITHPVHYIGIDPSLHSTGLAILTTEKDTTTQTTATIKPPKGLLGVVRLCWLREQCILEINKHLKYNIKALCIEDASYNSIGRQIDLAELRGVLKVMAVSLGVNPEVVAPTQLKKFGTGTGTATKDKMIAEAKAQGWIVDNDDEADAAHLAHMAYAIHNTNNPDLTRKQLEVLSARGITL